MTREPDFACANKKLCLHYFAGGHQICVFNIRNYNLEIIVLIFLFIFRLVEEKLQKEQKK